MTKMASEDRQPGREIDIVQLSEVRQEGLLDLLRTSLSSTGVTRKTEDFWRWKHQDNPFGESIGCAAKSRGEDALVAVRPLMRWTFTTPACTEVQALRPVDTVTHPDWRGMGLFSRLTRFSLNEVDGRSRTLIFNTPNDNSLPGYEKMGWARSDSLNLLVRPGGVFRIFRSFLAGIFGRRVSVSWRDLVGDTVHRSCEMSAHLIEEVVDFCVSSESARTPIGLRTKRTRAFMIWRYFSQPNADYGFLLVRNSVGDIVSVVVLRPEVRRWATAVFLVDVFVKKSGVDSVRSALRVAVRLVSADVLVAHAAKGSIERVAMGREKFLPMNSKVLAARVVGASDENAVLRGSAEDLDWDLSLADIEIF